MLLAVWRRIHYTINMYKRAACSVLMFLFCVCALRAATPEPFLQRLHNGFRATERVWSRKDAARLLMQSGLTMPQPDRTGFFGWLRSSEVTLNDPVKAVAGALYNMYVNAAVYDQTPKRLNLAWLGALDPLVMSESTGVTDLAAVYRSNKLAVKQELADLFAKRLKFPYDIKDPANDAQELAFLDIIRNSTSDGYSAGYLFARTSPGAPAMEERLTQELLQQQLACAQRNEGLICKYEMTDVLAALDSKGRGTQKTRYYRSVNEECDACSYSFCSQICAQNKRQFGDWQLARLYKITARPIAGAYVRAGKEGGFVSPAGKKYPDWNYHVVALLVLMKDDRLVYAVSDPMLYALPVELDVWASAFDARNTMFYVTPFRRSDAAEAQLLPLPADQQANRKQNRPVKIANQTLLPYPVNKP